MPPVDLAIPAFGYKNHVSIDREHGLIRKWMTSNAAAHDGARLGDVLDRSNTASDVWADTAYLGQERGHAERARLCLLHSSQEAEGQARYAPSSHRHPVFRIARRRPPSTRDTIVTKY
jgi:hypothetical protein